MKIVLRNDLEKIGKRGDIVDVSDGYARNYLIPRGQAFLATDGITSQATAMRTARDRADAKNRGAAEEVARKLVSAKVKIEARAGEEGKLFGSITNTEIVEALQAQTSIVVDRKQIEGHDNIRTVGIHSVPVKLHPDVRVALNLEIVSASE